MIRIKSLIFLIVYVSSNTLIAQCPTPDEEILLVSQEQVQEFANEYPNCEELLNGMRIIFCSEDEGTQISDLSPLKKLKRVSGGLSLSGCKDVEFSNLDFTNLSGLHNLESLDRLYVSSNNLKSLSELSKIDELVSIIIIDNEYLESLELGELNVVNYVSIQSNPNLSSLGSIQTRSHIDVIAITNNPLLDVGDSFEKLNSVKNLQLNNNDISFVSQIEEIDYLTVQGNAQVRDLSDFRSLKTLSTSLTLSDLDHLENLDFLEGVSTNSSFSLRMRRLSSLKDISDLGNKPEFLYLILDSCPLLEDISIFETVTLIEHELDIINMEGLLDLSAFENLLHIGNQLDIRENASLTDLVGFQKLESVGSEFYIRENPWLEEVDEFSRLTRIGLNSQTGYFAFHDNPSLASIQGLRNVEGGFEALSIYNNPILPMCHIQSVCETITKNSDARTRVYDNLVGCDSEVEIENQCLTVSLSDIETSQIILYPNPANRFIRFSGEYIDKYTNWRIYDTKGKCLKQGIARINQQVSISDLSSGIYFVEVNHNLHKLIIY